MEPVTRERKHVNMKITGKLHVKIMMPRVSMITLIEVISRLLKYTLEFQIEFQARGLKPILRLNVNFEQAIFYEDCNLNYFFAEVNFYSYLLNY